MNSIHARLTGDFLIAYITSSFCIAGERQTVDLATADAQLQKSWPALVAGSSPDPRTGRSRDWQRQSTTWLPSEWPPTPETIWTRYAYGLDVTMDGAAGVSAPIARLERRAGEAKVATLITMASRLEVVAVHPVRPTPGWRYTLEDEKAVLAHALSLTAAPPAKARATIALVSYYQSWRASHAEIAGLVASRHQAFFRWVEKARPSSASLGRRNERAFAWFSGLPDTAGSIRLSTNRQATELAAASTP